jgi:hypothetical protein
VLACRRRPLFIAVYSPGSLIYAEAISDRKVASKVPSIMAPAAAMGPVVMLRSVAGLFRKGLLQR